LLENDGDVNATNGNDDTPLGLALKENDIDTSDVIRLLLDAKPDLYLKNKESYEVWQLPYQPNYCTHAARVSFMNHLDLKSKLEFGIRIDFKNYKRIEGKNLSYKWNTSDQVIITTDKKIKVSLLVYPLQEDEDEEPKDVQVSYCITEMKDYRFKVPSYQQYAKSFGGTKPNDIQLNKDIIYHICPMVKDKDYVGNFGLVIYYNKGDPMISLAEDYKHHSEVESEWDEKTSGGMQMGTALFKNNPTFVLTFEDEEPELFCTIMLSQPSQLSTKFEVIPSQLNTGFYILDVNGKDMLYHTNWMNSSDVFESFKLDTTKRKKFLIIPTTQKEGEESKFALHVYSDHPHTLEKGA